MVDFKKLRESKAQPTVIEPIEIFRRLPKPPGINDLYVSQAQAIVQSSEHLMRIRNRSLIPFRQIR